MKTLICSFLMLLFTLSINAQTDEVISVENAKQFIDALGSNRILQLNGAIILSEISTTEGGSNYSFFEEYDGFELVISDVDNLKIVGIGNKPVKIITKPVYGDVLVFTNCKNITIENVDAGHGPEKGSCMGGVFNFSDSQNISISKSIMYGSGMEGITAENVTGLKCNNSIINGCSYSIMTLKQCKEFEFNNCKFSENEQFDLVNISGCSEIKFNACTFSGNQTGLEHYTDYALFNVDNSSTIVFKNCKIAKNKAAYLGKKANTVEFKDCLFENNQFKKGKFME